MSATDESVEDENQEPQVPPPDDQYEYYRPRPNLQVWLILGGIAFVIAVAVLFIYQAGDKKTILTMEPMQPAAFTPGRNAGNCPQPGMCGAQPVAFAQGGNGAGCPQPGMCGAQPVAFAQGQNGGACPQPGMCGAQPVAFGSQRGACGGVNCPTGGRSMASGNGGVNPTLAAALLPATPRQPARVQLPYAPPQNAIAQTAHCPRCGASALPLCAQCGSLMLPLNESLFHCPQCGAVGVPPCPYCGARMTPSEQREAPASAAVATAQGPRREAPEAVGGQFVCPQCNATGLPNWDATGVPLCPVCGTAMTVRGAQAAP